MSQPGIFINYDFFQLFKSQYCRDWIFFSFLTLFLFKSKEKKLFFMSGQKDVNYLQEFLFMWMTQQIHRRKRKKGILEDFSGQALGLTVIEFQYMKSQTFCKNQWQACTLPPCPVPPGGRTLHLFHIPPSSNRWRDHIALKKHCL